MDLTSLDGSKRSMITQNIEHLQNEVDHQEDQASDALEYVTADEEYLQTKMKRVRKQRKPA